MTDLIFLLFTGGVVLGVVPQLAGIMASRFFRRNVRLAGMILAVFVAPVTFWLIAQNAFGAGGDGALQSTEWATGKGYVHRPDVGVWFHAAVAFVIQLWMNRYD